MNVRSHHGVRFVTGLALVLSLAAQACIAGEVGDEEEIEAARAEPQTVEVHEATAPRAREERAPAGKQVKKAVPAAIHRLDDLCKGPRNHCDPPPSPW